MTLAELIDELSRHGLEKPVRFVIKEGEEGRQFECIGVMHTEGLHGPIALVFAGKEAGRMDWPTSISDD